jgi:hypothetical protein
LLAGLKARRMRRTAQEDADAGPASDGSGPHDGDTPRS